MFDILDFCRKIQLKFCIASIDILTPYSCIHYTTEYVSTVPYNFQHHIGHFFLLFLFCKQFYHNLLSINNIILFYLKLKNFKLYLLKLFLLDVYLYIEKWHKKMIAGRQVNVFEVHYSFNFFNLGHKVKCMFKKFYYPFLNLPLC